MKPTRIALEIRIRSPTRHSKPRSRMSTSVADAGQPGLGCAVTETVTPAPHQSPVRTALAGLIGNVLEWFDFAVYGYFVGAIGKQFFPAGDQTAQQLLAFAV